MIVSKNTNLTGKTRRKAFTLIELLIVIAILALLASILFPVFGRARENARRSSCQSNLKQLALGILQYTQDSDEKWPSGYFANGGSPRNRGEGWGGDIFPYVKSAQVFACPSDRSATNRISYAYNSNLTPSQYSNNGAGGWPAGQYVSVASMGSTAKTVLLFEIQGGVTANVSNMDEESTPSGWGPTSSYEGGLSPGGNWATGRIGNPAHKDDSAYWGFYDCSNGCSFRRTARHLEGANYAMADGHVKWFRSSTGEDSQPEGASPVSPGQANTDPACDQGRRSEWGGSCNVSDAKTAAGTDNSKFAVTFSPK